MSEAPEVQKKSWLYNMLPALTLMIMAPAVAELLPGATRISSAFVFPIEMLIWGSGAVLARWVVRRYRLGWFNLVLLAVALNLAEELLIQQTSFASLVVQIKGVEYGRALGFNYVYFIWAVLYEAIFVVCAPVALCEMMFPKRREQGWLNIWGIIPLVVLFVPASFAAWYGWNIIARQTVFHLEPYHIPRDYAVISAVVIAVLILAAAGPLRRLLAGQARPLTPPHPLILAVLGVVTAGVLFAIEVLAFGAAPEIPPAAPVAGGVVLGLAMLAMVPRWMASPAWTTWHLIAMVFAAVWGNFGFLFIGFGEGFDLYGKIVLDILGVLVMIWIAAFTLKHQPRTSS